jgi:short-subunit dehydrogenase
MSHVSNNVSNIRHSSLGTAFITGASSGIGAVYADRLARRGYDLILVARNRQRLDALADRIGKDTGRNVEVIVADLANTAELRAVEQVLRNDSSISLLVNNAGVGATTPLLLSDADKMDALIALNITSLTRLTQAVAPGLIARGGGSIINISSIVAVAPELLNGVYGGSKAYVLAFTQSLHHELADEGIKVQAVLPGAIATEFWDIAGLPVSNLPTAMVMSAEHLVDAALAGYDQGELVTLPSLPDAADWTAADNARKALAPNLSHALPAKRFGLAA